MKPSLAHPSTNSTTHPMRSAHPFLKTTLRLDTYKGAVRIKVNNISYMYKNESVKGGVYAHEKLMKQKKIALGAHGTDIVFIHIYTIVCGDERPGGR
jgi:hypothetical protein